VEAGMSWISSVAFFGSKREIEGSEKASKRSLSVRETNRELFREPEAGGTGADEVAASCEQRRLAEYSISGQRSGEDTTSLRREDVARTLKTAKVTYRDVFLDAKVHGGSAQPIRH
jgi:hypothetical protein